MSTSRPKIVIYSDEKALAKLQVLAKEQRRSVSNLCDIILQKYIERYEIENGKINIEQ